MKATSYSHLRANLKTFCDEVADTGEALLIHRRGRADIALVSLRELSALEETAHLLRSPANAQRLLEAWAEVQSGGGVTLSTAELRERVGAEDEAPSGKSRQATGQDG
ncbi:MAG: type II toxin-antitoxin system prevent-host-death family antitoxin [Acidobacteriota bacterium]